LTNTLCLLFSSISVRLLVFTQETENSLSMGCTSIWTLTTLSGINPSRRTRDVSSGGLKTLHISSSAGQNNHQFCTCSILDILRGEAAVLEGLHNLGIKGEHQGNLLRLPVNTVDDSYTLDIRHPAIMVSHVQKHASFDLSTLS